jgi:hypothetical protein
MNDQITPVLMRIIRTLVVATLFCLCGETRAVAGTKWQGHCRSPLAGIEFPVSARTPDDVAAKCALVTRPPIVDDLSEVPCSISDQDCTGGSQAAISACSVGAPLAVEGEAVRVEAGETKRICAITNRPVTKSSCLMTQYEAIEEYSWCVYDTASRNGCAIGWVRSVNFVYEAQEDGMTVYCWVVRNESPFRSRGGRIYLD